MRSLYLLLAFLCLAAAPSPAPAADVVADQTLYPDADAWIDDSTFDNKGSDPEFRVGNEGGVEYRTLIHFDLSSLKKDPVRSAILRICAFNSGQGKDYKFMRAQALYRPWDEKAVTWVASEKDDHWHLKGADCLPTAYGGADIARDAGGGKERWYCLDVTTLIQAWQNKSLKNYGLLLMNEKGSDIMFRMHSREDAASRPHLLLSYTGVVAPPEPTVHDKATIEPLPVQPYYNPEIALKTLNAATAGELYKVQLKAYGGERPYKWEAVGNLPEGLTLTPDGVLSGIIAKAATISIKVKCTAADKKSDQITYKLVVQQGQNPPPPGPGNPANPAGGPNPAGPPAKPKDPKLPNDDG